MRVLLSSTWGVGHVFPMVPLAQAFVAARHEVLWVAPGPAVALVEGAGVPVSHGGLDDEGVRRAIARLRELTAPLPPQDRAPTAFRQMFGSWGFGAMIGDLLAAGRRFRPNLMVHEPAELAAPLVAALLGVPCVTHSWGQAVPAAVLAGARESVAATWAEHGLAVPEHAGMFKDGYLDVCPPAVQHVPTEHITNAMPMRPVPYAGSDSLEVGELPPRPLAYVTLGTVFTEPHVLRQAVAATQRAGASVLAAVGRQVEPGEVAQPSPTVQVRSWVPQAALLPHVDVVVSHGGSGTFLGALASGLPQVCLPQAADQFRNAQALVASGTGIALEPHEVTPDALEHAVRDALHEPRFRQSAQAVAHQIAEMPDPTDVAGALARRHA